MASSTDSPPSVSARRYATPLPLAGRKKFKGVLSAREGGWRLTMESPEGSKKDQPEQVLDFVFDEVREARLVPVVNFKGRQATKPALQSEERTR